MATKSKTSVSSSPASFPRVWVIAGTLVWMALTSAGCAATAGSRGSDRPQASGQRPQGTDGFESFSAAESERIAAVAPLVEQAATKHRVDASLVYAVIWVESRFDPKATSSAGARGLMQLMPATAAGLAKELGLARPRIADPQFNVTAGTYYLARLSKRFDGDTKLAIAAYHAGSGNVSKWEKSGQAHPEWSQDYVGKVLEAQQRFAGQPKGQPGGASIASTEATDQATGVGSVFASLPSTSSTMSFDVSAFESRANIYETVEIDLDAPVFEPDLSSSPAPATSETADDVDARLNTDDDSADRELATDGTQPRVAPEDGATVSEAAALEDVTSTGAMAEATEGLPEL